MREGECVGNEAVRPEGIKIQAIKIAWTMPTLRQVIHRIVEV